jgi:hypothetical protein
MFHLRHTATYGVIAIIAGTIRIIRSGSAICGTVPKGIMPIPIRSETTKTPQIAKDLWSMNRFSVEIKCRPTVLLRHSYSYF